MPSAADARRYAAAYAQRMNKVLDHIDGHLDETLELADLAAVAHFSPFHFHRVFAAWMGETVGDYLRRRRLDTAAIVLAAGAQSSVLEVALAVGFGSGEAFARAFRQRFGCTPSAWRAATSQRWLAELKTMRQLHADRNPGQGVRNPDQAPAFAPTDDGDLIDRESSMAVTITTLPAARVAYMRHIGRYGPAVGDFWRDTFMPWLLAEGLAERPRYGIGRDDPCITPADNCRYDACVEVPDDFVARGAVGIAAMPGGRYAVTDFEGTPADLDVAYTELLRDWLPASGLQADGRPFYEYYPVGARYDARAGTFQCRLCLAVRAA